MNENDFNDLINEVDSMDTKTYKELHLASKQKLIQLRCRAWGITEDEYYVKQCGDFEIEDMNRAYRRGRNKANDELVKSKEIIKKLLSLYFAPVVTQDDLKKQDEIIEMARKFVEE